MAEPMAYSTTRGPSWDSIVAMASDRLIQNSPLMEQMREVRDRYNGDVVYPWSEALTGGQDMPNLTPHLIGESIDNYGLRAASVMPALMCPAIHPGAEKGMGSREWARIRRRSLSATLMENKFPLIARRFYRHLAGYATASLLVEPDFRTNMPKIRVMNPLNTFPDQRAAEDYENVENCIYIHGHSAAQLIAQFPHLSSTVGGPINPSSPNSDIWDTIRYVDGDVMVFGLAGRRSSWDSDARTMGRFKSATELRRIDNRMERFPGITMGRVTLDRMGSALAHIMGQVDWAARLQLLDVVATEKAIYPDTYILGEGNRTPTLHTPTGRWVDGRTGDVNIVHDAAAIGQLRNTPDPSGKQSIDRMERNVRSTLGLAAQFGGETSNAIRTGRGMDTMMGISVDPRIHEMQEIGQAWLPDFFGAVLSCWETYWPDEEFSMYSGYPGDGGEVTFTPGKHFAESKKVSVSYPIAGADLQLTNISLSQMLGTKAISLATFRKRHPWIDDAEAEGKLVLEEDLESLAFQAMAQQAMGGQIPIEQLAYIEEEWRDPDTHNIFEAIRKATEKLKEMQAAAEPEPEEDMQMDPSMAPGLGGPTGPMGPGGMGPGGEPPIDTNTIGPPSGVEGLRELQNALAAGGRRVNGMEGP